MKCAKGEGEVGSQHRPNQKQVVLGSRLAADCQSTKDSIVIAKDYLTQSGTPFTVLKHSKQVKSKCQTKDVAGPNGGAAQTVVLKLDQGVRYAVAVIPQSMMLDRHLVSQMLGGSHVELATETQLSECCRDCERGGVPPFGAMFGMVTLVDGSLTHSGDIVVEGNRPDESICMKWSDFRSLVSPLVGTIAVPLNAQVDHVP